jgi:hypothetical protein
VAWWARCRAGYREWEKKSGEPKSSSRSDLEVVMELFVSDGIGVLEPRLFSTIATEN